MCPPDGFHGCETFRVSKSAGGTSRRMQVLIVAVLLAGVGLGAFVFRSEQRPTAPTAAEAEADVADLLDGSEHPGFIARCETPVVDGTWTCRARDTDGNHGFAIYSMAVQQSQRLVPGYRSVLRTRTTFSESTTADGAWVVDGTGLAVAEWQPSPPRSASESYPADLALMMLAADAQRALGLSIGSHTVPFGGYTCPPLDGFATVQCTAPAGGVGQAEVTVSADRIRLAFRVDMAAAVAEAEAAGVSW